MPGESNTTENHDLAGNSNDLSPPTQRFEGCRHHGCVLSDRAQDAKDAPSTEISNLMQVAKIPIASLHVGSSSTEARRTQVRTDA